MVEKPFLSSLRLSAGTAVNLRSGDLVSVQVLKRLGAGRWAVGIKGRTVPAASELELIPGQRLRAQVVIHQGRTVLRLREGRGGQVEDIVRRAGLPQEPEVRHIVSAFLRSGLGVRSEEVLQVRRLLDKLRLQPRRSARLAAVAMEKGIDPRSPGLEELLPVLDFGEDRGQRRRYRGRQMPEEDRDFREALPAGLTEEREQDSALQLFNHLGGREGSWVIIPFHFTWRSGSRLYGTLRLLYDAVKGTSNRFILVVEKEVEGDAGEVGENEPRRRWSFSLDRGQPGEKGCSMSVFCNDPEAGAAARKEFRQLRAKLQNLGVKTDDTIRIDDEFDGLSPEEDAPLYRGVDLER